MHQGTVISKKWACVPIFDTDQRLLTAVAQDQMVGETWSPLLCSLVCKQDRHEAQVIVNNSRLVSAHAAFCANSRSHFLFPISIPILFLTPCFAPMHIAG